MELKLNSSELLKALLQIKDAVASNPILPILENFKFEIDSNRLAITSSNLNVTMLTFVNIGINGNHSFTIPAKILLDTLSSIKGKDIIITKNNNIVEIKTESSKFKLASDPSTDFPKLNYDTNESDELQYLIEIDNSILSNSINTIVFAASTDELRHNLNGIFLDIDSKNISFVATDTHKLAKISYNNDKNITKSLIIPRHALNILKSIKSTEKVKIRYNSTMLELKYTNLIIHIKLHDAKYPNYKAILHDTPTEVIKIQKNMLLNALKRILPFSDSTICQVKIKINNNKIILETESTIIQTRAFEIINIASKLDITVFFDIKHLIDVVNSMQDDYMEISIISSSKPAIITQNNYKVLLMPIMANQ